MASVASVEPSLTTMIASLSGRVVLAGEPAELVPDEHRLVRGRHHAGHARQERVRKVAGVRRDRTHAREPRHPQRVPRKRHEHDEKTQTQERYPDHRAPLVLRDAGRVMRRSTGIE